MKTLFYFLLIPAFLIASGGNKNYLGKTIYSKQKVEVPNVNAGKGILLSYLGSMSGPINQQVSINMEIDPAIGFRTDLVIENGDQVVGHHAFFIKYSDNNNGYAYNYLTHKVNALPVQKGANGSPDDDLIVVGQKTMLGYPCTHLRVDNSKDRENDEDYWMSTAVPGYKTLSDLIIKNFNKIPGSNSKLLSSWGLLVKYSGVVHDKNGGIYLQANTTLHEANPNMSFPASDFEVPKGK